MSALILPQRLQQQPQQAAVIDTGNALARGLRAVVLPGMPEIVTGAATAGTAPYGVTQAGRAWAFAGVATQFIEVPSIAYQAPPFSVLVVVRKSATAADALVSFGGASAGNGWKIGSGTAATTFRLTYGGVADYSLTNFWDTTGGVTVAVVTVQGTVARVFKGGRFFGQITVGTPKVPASKPLTIGALHNGTSYAETSTSSISAAALWPRALSDAEALALSGNPWQPLKAPPRRLWAVAQASPAAADTAQPPAAGGGGGAGSVREVRAFADELGRARKPTKGEKKRRKQAIEAAVLELLPDEPAAERLAPVIAQIVARELPPATWAPVHGPRPIILPPAVVADVRARVAAWLAHQQLLAELEDEFETELLLLG